MTKRKDENPWMTIIKEFFSTIMSWIAQYLEDLFLESEYVVNLKKKIRNYAFFIVMMIIGCLLILNGLALWLNSLFANMPPGIFHMILGAIIMIVAITYKAYH